MNLPYGQRIEIKLRNKKDIFPTDKDLQIPVTGTLLWVFELVTIVITALTSIEYTAVGDGPCL